MNAPQCEVHFLDVGQGSSSVILFHNEEENRREAIVIDCGPGSLVPLEVLERFADYVRAVVITHNHADHAGGATKIIRGLISRGKVGRLYLVADGSTGAKRLGDFLLKEEERIGREIDHTFLHKGDIYRSRISNEDFVVEALAPRAAATMAESKPHPHEVGGVVRLTFHGHSILFCGDASGRTWRRIFRRSNEVPMRCEAVTAPHHGGKMAGPIRGSQFFRDFVKAEKAIFSFCASNRYGHPRAEVVDAALGSGATVLCTQITPSLHRCLDRETLEEGVISLTRFSLSKRRDRKVTGEGRRVHVACAGSITVSLGPAGPRWGNQGDPDPVCGFETLDQFQREAVTRCGARCPAPPCHSDFVQVGSP